MFLPLLFFFFFVVVFKAYLYSLLYKVRTEVILLVIEAVLVFDSHKKFIILVYAIGFELLYLLIL